MHTFTKSTSKLSGQNYCQKIPKPISLVANVIMTVTTKAVGSQTVKSLPFFSDFNPNPWLNG